MWLVLAFLSAVFLGFYDVSKKASLKGNAILPVLFLNTLLSTLIFSPCLIDSLVGASWFSGTVFDTAMLNPSAGEEACTALQAHLLIVAKSVIVLSSWVLGYAGIKHLPITVVGPINATRPVLVLVGAMVIFGERLNLWQWAGVILSAVSLFLLSLSSKKENIDFRRNRWIWCIAAAALIGAASGLYDRFLLRRLGPVFVQSWYNFYQMCLMAVAVTVISLLEKKKGVIGDRFRWRWSIILISLFLSVADFAYMYSLSLTDSMISVVSLVRRGSVIISFLCGALLFKEKNLRAKALDLALILAGMVFIWLGSR